MMLTEWALTEGLNLINTGSIFFLNHFMYCSYIVVGKCVCWLDSNEKKVKLYEVKEHVG